VTTAIAGGLWALGGAMRGFEPVTLRALAWFAGAGVFTAFIGRVFFYAAIERVGAMRSSTTKRLIPFFAVILGVAVLGEPLTAGMVAGVLLIGASFAVLLKAGARRGGAEATRAMLRAGYTMERSRPSATPPVTCCARWGSPMPPTRCWARPWAASPA
jgi:uncharacterized membrane protein